ncbi:MAG: DUF885 family protein [Balneolaceae bacterium]
MQNYLAFFFLTVIFFVSGHPAQAQPSPKSTQISDLIAIYRADHGALSRKYAVQASDEYLQRFEEFYEQWLSSINSLGFESLSRSEKVDFTLFKNDIERSLYFLAEKKRDFKKIKDFLPVQDSIMSFINKRRTGTSFDGKEVAADFNLWNQETLDLKDQLEGATPFSKKEAGNLAAAISDLQKGIKEAYGFYYGYDPDFTWWAAEPFEHLDNSLKEYAAFAENHFDKESEKDDGSGIIGNPIGRDEILRRLKFEMISYTPEELIEIANKQFEWSEREMLKASREMGYGDDWKAALEAVKGTYVEEGEQPALVTKLANEAINFVEERDLVTIPDLAKETWRMVMLSPEQQLVAPFFLGGEVVRIAYPTNSMDQEAKMMSMRGNNPHFSKAVVHHELIPGHHLQQFMTQRYETHRRMFYTPFWTEGWALYWEMVLWNKEFAESPEDKIGMLYWRMHRCARIVFSLSYHLGDWTPQQSIDYLVEKVGHERANAEAEVRRSFEGNYGPLYQIAYMTGAMQLYSLRLELVESGQMSEKDFHDAILQQNSIPIAMLKALLTNENLSENYEPDWQFGDYLDGM